MDSEEATNTRKVEAPKRIKDNRKRGLKTKLTRIEGEIAKLAKPGRSFDIKYDQSDLDEIWHRITTATKKIIDRRQESLERENRKENERLYNLETTLNRLKKGKYIFKKVDKG